MKIPIFCGFWRGKSWKTLIFAKIGAVRFVTTAHKDVTDRLMQINPALARQARKVLDVNKSERHIRGGLATREKYLHQHQIGM